MLWKAMPYYWAFCLSQKACVMKILSHEELCLTKKIAQKFQIISILQLDSFVAFERCSKECFNFT